MTRHVQDVVPSQVAPAAFRHDMPGQQGLLGEHACPPLEQVAPDWHFPLMSPWRMLQRSPAQQSAPAVHTPFSGWQTAGTAQTPPEQIPEQHPAPEEHVAPVAEQLPPTLPPSSVEPTGT